MRKKITLMVVMTILSVATISSPAIARFCIVSFQPENNGGSCEADPGGGSTCYMSGTGPSCSGTGGW